MLELSEPAANPKGTAMGWALTIAVAVVLTIVVKTFILQAYSIPSESMVPTLNVGDRVVVFRLNTDPARATSWCSTARRTIPRRARATPTCSSSA